jgi:hypothetical protein
VSTTTHDLDGATIIFTLLLGASFAKGHVHLTFCLPPTAVTALPPRRTIVPLDTMNKRNRESDDKGEKVSAHKKTEQNEGKENKYTGMLGEAIPRNRYFHWEERVIG